VRGVVAVELSGTSLVNVEVFTGGRLLARAVVAPDGTRAVAQVDTSALPDGPVTLTAHGWDSPAGTAFTGEADAGGRSFTVANAGGGPVPTTTTRPATTTGPSTTTTSAPPADGGCGPRPAIPVRPPLVGVYTGNDPAEVTRFEGWLGRPVDGILGYTGDADWVDYDGSVGWAVGVWSRLDRPVLWSVPLIPRGATLEAAARGEYDDHYRRAAEQLARYRPQDPVVYLRTGWEFNGDWFPWAAAGRAEAFKEAFHRFATEFRKASPRFAIEWNVNIGLADKMNPETAYPGDCDVDIVGMDFYWNTAWDPKDATQAWDSMRTRPYGLDWHARFAAAHGKRMAYSEWGVGTAEGRPYVEAADRWFTDHQVVYQTYWDSNSAFTGKLSDGQYPASATAYRAAFG
jgi:hypothetical protein